jgi:hypothetical protein
MRLQWRDTRIRIGAAALLFVIAAAGIAWGGGAGRDGASHSAPAPKASPTPAATPAASPAPQPAPSPAASATPQDGSAVPAVPAEEPPRIVRTVCTDHVCGGCDGKCRKSTGHVAVDKKGHCACTPTDGSALDRAIRQAYERRPPQ